MLVLTRRIGEVVTIGDNTVVHVRAVSGNRVIIGIEAPQDLRILRGELNSFDAPRSARVAPTISSPCVIPGGRRIKAK